MAEETVDERLKREVGDTGRRSRVTEDRDAQERAVTQDRTLSEDDRLQMFRQQLFNDALPDLPKIPGYHVCWLTTANPRDPIHRRIMLGYEPVKASEIPGFEYTSLKTGEWEGCIGVNEMVAFKLPESLYQAFMKEAHHDAPAREAAGLVHQLDVLKEQADRDKGQIIEGDGIEELRKSPPKGVFSD